jgi:hypothetical protein
MRRALRWLGISIAAGVAAIALVFFGARFHDGPIGMFKGGAFRSGEPAPAPADWSFAAADQTLELELPVDVGQSITAWLAVQDGRLYVPCGLCESKRWAREVLRDGNVRVRLDGKIYELRATRVEDPATLERVRPILVEKYGARPEGVSDRTWFFALEPR